MNKIFATLCGTDCKNIAYLKIYADLLEIAYLEGFNDSKENQRPRANQTSLDKWSLWLKGSNHENCLFMLSVTAPDVPLMAPIPITKEINGPLFAVVVNKNYFLISREGEISEVKDEELIKNEFKKFLTKIAQ